MEKNSWNWFWSKFPSKNSHIGLQHSHGMRIFLWKDQIIPIATYCHPLSGRRRPPPFAIEPSSATTLCHRTTAGCCRTIAELPLNNAELPSAATGPPPATGLRRTFKGFFENEQNILGNSIRLPNTLKNTCLRKLFLGITFPEIGFPKMKI